MINKMSNFFTVSNKCLEQNKLYIFVFIVRRSIEKVFYGYKSPNKLIQRNINRRFYISIERNVQNNLFSVGDTHFLNRHIFLCFFLTLPVGVPVTKSGDTLAELLFIRLSCRT